MDFDIQKLEIKKTVISDSYFSRCKYIKYSEKMHKIPFFFFLSFFVAVCKQLYYWFYWYIWTTSREFEPWICWGEYIPFLRPVTAFGRTKIGTQILIDQLKINIDTV